MSKYTEQDLVFSDLILERGDFRVTWEWIGEGWSGDYDEEDEQDDPLLRFSVDQHIFPDEDSEENAESYWEQLDDASYCTRLPITTPTKHLAIAAAQILEEVEDHPDNYKRELESLSWFEPDDFKKYHQDSLKEKS